MHVFLILQKQLEHVVQQQRLVSVSIQRVEMKKWLPLFQVKDETGRIVTCSLRLQASEEARYWADLRLLAEWLREKCGVERCELVMTDFNLKTGEKT
ncbi:KorA family transcriptional regulator [Caballeronia sp. SBC2]|uniref:KorA family transcriptional regulator n=1 Tax=Caballeronia sp. SBC2 TaxID=2705547 RepID=UPI0013E160FD|nr:KorA family transcriptional regulator [Caballeronia sp. SBC2]QIE30485.1 hypothetical protein SBC2_85620 [Caballeronia sp. SBC2]